MGRQKRESGSQERTENVRRRPQRAARTEPLTVGEFLGQVVKVVLTVVVLALLVCAGLLFYAWYDWMATQPAAVARGWAIVATVLVPLGLIGGTALGLRLTEYRLRWKDEDTDRILDKISTSIYQAGIQSSDVRVYGFRRLFNKEEAGAQEIDLPSAPWLENAVKGQTVDEKVEL